MLKIIESLLANLKAGAYAAVWYDLIQLQLIAYDLLIGNPITMTAEEWEKAEAAMTEAEEYIGGTVAMAAAAGDADKKIDLGKLLPFLKFVFDLIRLIRK